MERLVIKSKAGSYYLNDTARGVMFEPHETEPHQRRLLLKRLYAYEDTGLTPDQIRELKERNTPKEAIYEGDGYSDEEMVYDTWICPNCGAKYEVDYDDYDFCPDCGQMILR